MDKTIKLWSIETFTEIATLTGHVDYVKSIMFNNIGIILASGSNDGRIIIWNLETFKQVTTLIGHNQSV